MNLKDLYIGMIGVFLASAACDSKIKRSEHSSIESRVKINNLETNRISLTNDFFADGTLNVGVVSDIEGAIDRAELSAKALKDNKVDIILIAGDLYENENIRKNPLYPTSTNNVDEMLSGIRPYAKIGVPVFVIAGNHEESPVYTNALALLKKEFPHVHDISRRSADLNGINIVGLGGYHDPKFIAKQGFMIKRQDYMRSENEIVELMQKKDPLVFMTHGPPLATNNIDYVKGVGHVGDPEIARILSNKYSRQITHVHGHIHEGGGTNSYYPAGFSINVSSITPYNSSQRELDHTILIYPKK
ncbi:hypothetical protein FJZ18_00320 [Candidatus Pacearchaeota archaeon]|nr:hypothetical protein [Candidatus Pacearchaeota archaeon]